jgi:hypothetical protein
MLFSFPAQTCSYEREKTSFSGEKPSQVFLWRKKKGILFDYGIMAVKPVELKERRRE